MVTLVLTLLALVPAEAARTFDVVFEDCVEFVGLTAVDPSTALDVVPESLPPVITDDGALLVIRTVSCEGISVGGFRPVPGTLSQIGVNLLDVDGTADIDNYTLFYTTTDPRLAARLRLAGMVVARRSRVLPFRVRDGELLAFVPERRTAGYVLRSDVMEPVADTVPFIARWYAEGRRGTVVMTTDFPDLRFGTASSEVFSRAGGLLEAATGQNAFTFFFDTYNAFSRAEMVVTVE